MPENVSEELRRIIEAIYRSESGRILAALVRLLGDLDVAEEAMHEAFAAALDTWTQADITAKPRPWLISTAGWARSSAAVLPDASALEFGC